MFFQTSTPKKRSLTHLPRSSTPKKFYNLIKPKIKDHDDQLRIKSENCCQNYPLSTIKLDLLLYRPKTECYHRQTPQQIWDI